MQVVVELALILMNVKEMGEMRVNIIFIAKVNHNHVPIPQHKKNVKDNCNSRLL